MKRLPLYEAIKEYAGRTPARFHMPGHKGRISPYDVTEVNGTDNLQAPTGAILESQLLCAEAYSSRDAFFLVNGSTAGNLAMLNLIGRGKRVLLGRGCHKSVVNGLAFAGLKAKPLFPDENGLHTAEEVARALDECFCDAVFITSPTYRGAVQPIESIAHEAHKRGAMLLVDAAHGAHFAFSEKLPPLPSSADMYCISTHKTLSAMTQTALLLAGNSCPYSFEEILRVLNMVQSTSPSYELMLSIERAVLEPVDIDSHFDRIMLLRSELEKLPGVHLLGSTDTEKQDMTRLNIAFDGMSGRELERELEENGIVPEMADAQCVTLITSPCDDPEWYYRLKNALSDLEARTEGNIRYTVKLALSCGETVMSVREAVFAKKEYLPLVDAVGRIAADPVGVYPPGVAVLFPGEIITESAVKLLIDEEDAGAALFGMHGGSVAVVDE